MRQRSIKSFWFSSEGRSPIFQPLWRFRERPWPFYKLFPLTLGCYHHTLQSPQVRALLIWAGGEEMNPKGEPRKFPAPGAASPVPEPFKTAAVIHNAAPHHSLLGMLSEGSRRPLGISFGRKPGLSRSRAHPLGRTPLPSTCCHGFWSPSHCVVLTWS